jgi:hypothetical protein
MTLAFNDLPRHSILALAGFQEMVQTGGGSVRLNNMDRDAANQKSSTKYQPSN